MKKKIALFLVMILIICITIESPTANAADNENSIEIISHPGGNIVFTVNGNLVKDGKGANGFSRNFNCYESSELSSNALKCDISFSARRRSDQWGVQRVTKGYNLKSLAENLGVPTSGNIKISYKASDGYSNTYSNIWGKKYAYQSPKGTIGTEVEPMLAIEGNYVTEFNGHVAGETLGVPVIMIGQTTAAGDYNAQYMGKNTKELTFGNKKVLLTIDNNGINKSLSSGDIAVGMKAGTNIGRWQGTYKYDDGAHEIIGSGVTLDRLLANANIPMNNAEFVATSNKGVKKNIAAKDLDKYFVAYEGTLDKNIMEGDVGPLILLGPGNTESEVLMTNFTGLKVTTQKPRATKTAVAKKYSYNKIKLTWSQVVGANGYYIDRYDYSTKKWTNEIYDTQNGNRLYYINSGLKTGVSYKYRIRAYVVVGSAEVLGNGKTSNITKATLNKSAITKLKKSGKTGVYVKWKKISGASGYVIKYNNKTMVIKSGKTVAKTVRSLKHGKKYKFKVRSYRTVYGKKIYGSYSTTKSIKR